MAQTQYFRVILDSTYSVPTGPQSGHAIYTVDRKTDKSKWQGWHFEVAGDMLQITPPNRYATTEIPLVHVKSLVRECDPLPADGKPAVRRVAASGTP